MVYYLTKSRYLNGLQCQKRLWYEKNHPERTTAASRSQQRIFNQGKEVGRRAQELFPGGHLIDARDSVGSIEQTQSAISSGIPYIFEASFISNGIWVRYDILEKDSDSWKIIEVKASNNIKDKGKYKKEYLHDLAIQKHVLTECGIPISGTQLMHTNRECVYPDLSNLFVIEDVTDQVNQLMDDVPNNIETFKAILAEDVEPEVLIGEQCEKPHPCPFKDHCWKDVPERSIFTIPRLSWKKKNKLVEKDSLSVYSLTDDFRQTELTENQSDDINMVLDNRPKIDKEAIRRKLSKLKYPIYFFDFETSNPALPRFEGLNPYQQFPFQYSCHILQSDDSLTHGEYLHPDTTDPRLPLVESLLSHISGVGSVVVYNARFERDILKDLAKFFPEHSETLQSIISRLWDQLVIFRNHYKHPEFYGSNSLKDVLPVLVPCLSYEDLDIQEGDDAQAVWDKMINTPTGEARDNMINDLRAYCEMDTLATVEIHKALVRQVNEL